MNEFELQRLYEAELTAQIADECVIRRILNAESGGKLNTGSGMLNAGSGEVEHRIRRKLNTGSGMLNAGSGEVEHRFWPTRPRRS